MSRDFQQTHENLLFCAQKHFLEYGFERASIREICKDAHVTNGAFYNHFDDKEALFGALVESVVQEVKAIYEASVNEHMELSGNPGHAEVLCGIEISGLPGPRIGGRGVAYSAPCVFCISG